MLAGQLDVVENRDERLDHGVHAPVVGGQAIGLGPLHERGVLLLEVVVGRFGALELVQTLRRDPLGLDETLEDDLFLGVLGDRLGLGEDLLLGSEVALFRSGRHLASASSSSSTISASTTSSSEDASAAGCSSAGAPPAMLSAE